MYLTLNNYLFPEVLLAHGEEISKSLSYLIVK